MAYTSDHEKRDLIAKNSNGRQLRHIHVIFNSERVTPAKLFWLKEEQHGKMRTLAAKADQDIDVNSLGQTICCKACTVEYDIVMRTISP